MPSAQSLLVVASAIIIFTLGALHLLLTYRSRWFYPRDPDLESQMKAVAPLISQETTMWRAGIGFHASHSAGAMLFSLAYAYLRWSQRSCSSSRHSCSLSAWPILPWSLSCAGFTGFASRSGVWHWQRPSTPALSLRTGPNQTMAANPELCCNSLDNAQLHSQSAGWAELELVRRPMEVRK
jgi:hypothetical protein